MFTIHCSAKLATTLKIKPEAEAPSTTRLGAWYGTQLGGPRGPFVLISERTYLPVFVSRCPPAQLQGAMIEALTSLLTSLDVPPAMIEAERAEMAQSRWGKNSNRTLVAVLNEQARMAGFLLEDGLPLDELKSQLAENIVKSSFPIELTRQAFGLRAPPKLKLAPRPVELRFSELLVLAHQPPDLLCQLVGSSQRVTLRTKVLHEVPGQILTVRTTKQWAVRDRVFVEGQMLSSRIDVAALGLPPLALSPEGDWDPAEEYWGEEGDELPAWTQELIAQGPRPAFEMEQVLPGADPDAWDSDPITRANDLKHAGRHAESRALLHGMLAQDLRCLDAHAHLGNVCFDERLEQAVRHYRVGVELGEQALGPNFRGVLPWGLVDNRPYLRCLHGLGLCLWRAGAFAEARAVLRRMLWLNPPDNQGARFVLSELERGLDWQPEHD